MELQKEAIEKIVELADPRINTIDGATYLFHKTGDDYTQVHATPEFPETLALNSLDALVAMIKTEAVKRHAPPFYLMAKAHDSVKCYTQPMDILRNERAVLYNVIAADVPGWADNTQLPFEEALIAIRTRFQQSPDIIYLLKLLSDITNGAKVTYSDNGMATTVVTQKGVALQGSDTIRPIVKLRPYRTFLEIDQPESEFHIRVSERGIKFIEADGGMWKLTARRTIAEYLSERLADMVGSGDVIVTV